MPIFLYGRGDSSDLFSDTLACRACFGKVNFRRVGRLLFLHLSQWLPCLPTDPVLLLVGRGCAARGFATKGLHNSVLSLSTL